MSKLQWLLHKEIGAWLKKGIRSLGTIIIPAEKIEEKIFNVCNKFVVHTCELEYGSIRSRRYAICWLHRCTDCMYEYVSTM